MCGRQPEKEKTNSNLFCPSLKDDKLKKKKDLKEKYGKIQISVK